MRLSEGNNTRGFYAHLIQWSRFSFCGTISQTRVVKSNKCLNRKTLTRGRTDRFSLMLFARCLHEQHEISSYSMHANTSCSAELWSTYDLISNLWTGCTAGLFGQDELPCRICRSKAISSKYYPTNHTHTHTHTYIAHQSHYQDHFRSR